MSIELALATKKMATLKAEGRGYYACVQQVMQMLVGQGFSEGYAQQIAERAFDLV